MHLRVGSDGAANAAATGNEHPQMPTEGAAPKKDRLQETLHEHDIKGEKAIAAGQAGICCFVLVLHLLAHVGHGWETVNLWVVVCLAGLIGTSIQRFAIAPGRT